MQHAIRVAALFCLLAFTAIFPAHAQSFSIVELPGGCGTGSYANSLSYLTVDSQLKLCVNATVSASITGFPGTSQSTGTPISVTTGGVTGTLPSGAVVVASNVGATNGAYCKLGASATTSDQLIPPNSWFAFTVGANTQLTCITSTSTTTVNMVGGSGLPTGSGGGGGGSGGGAVTLASGAVASGAYSSGSIASGAFASGSIASGALASGSISNGASVAQGSTTDSPATLPASATAASQIALEKAIANAVSAPSTGLAGTTPTTSTPVASGATSAVQTDLHGNIYIAPSQVVTTGGATTANSVPMIANSQYPANSVTTTPTPLVAKGAGSTGAVTGTLTPAATATAYVCGFNVSYVGGTAQVGPLILSGLLGGSFTYQIPVATATGGQTFTQTFTPCIPASAVNTAIVMTTVADGTATAVDVNIWGYGL